jgi:hypothetical protein
LEEAELKNIMVDLWLYGELARYGGRGAGPGYANLQLSIPARSTLHDLLNHLGMATEERGITFINNKLSAMVGMQPDLDYRLTDNDRVAFFHLKSMWPCQYRQNAAMTEEMLQAMNARDDKGPHHT